MADQAKKLLNAVTGTVTHSPPDVQYGIGNAADEWAKCTEIHVFARLSGNTYTKYHALLPKDTQLRHLKAVFEKAHSGSISQELLVDERGYTFCPEALEQPLYKFSNRCQLQVDFVHRDGAVIETGRNLASYTTEKVGAVKKQVASSVGNSKL